MTDVAFIPLKPRPLLQWRKVGGLRHWRIGAFGGSFYFSKGN